MKVTAPTRRWRALSLLLIAPSVQAQHLAQAFRPLSRTELCVTEGTLEPSAEASLTVTTPKMRAVASVPVADAAEMRFTYLGSTDGPVGVRSDNVRMSFARAGAVNGAATAVAVPPCHGESED